MGEDEEDEEEVGEEEKTEAQSSRQLVPPSHVNQTCSLHPTRLDCSQPAMVKRVSAQFPVLLGQVGIHSDVLSEAPSHGHAKDDKREIHVYKYFINSWYGSNPPPPPHPLH